MSERPKADQKLIQIVDAAVIQNAGLCGAWLACRPGCYQCCIGVFEISQLDAVRLQEGLAVLRKTDPKRAEEVRRRAEGSWRRLKSAFPGNTRTGILRENDEAFEDFGNDEPCPALDPATGTCDLYAHRPMTCRVFGPPVRSQEGIGVCELCFVGANEQAIANCELVADPEDVESRVTKQYEQQSGRTGKTIVAWALRSPLNRDRDETASCFRL